MTRQSIKQAINSTVIDSVIKAMDGTSSSLYPYLPYIFQDLWEIGTSPEAVLTLVKKHTTGSSNLRVLDLGCGKGAVLIKLATEIQCQCLGVDAMEEFIEQAKLKAATLDVAQYSRFECSDIRDRVSGLNGYDVIILGSVGSIFGDYLATLTKTSKCIKKNGLILIDDCYIDDGSDYSHPLVEKKSEILDKASDAGMNLIDEIIPSKGELKESDENIFKNIKMRCLELIQEHPGKGEIFVDYIRKQEEENAFLEEKVVCATMVFSPNFERHI